jgi:hypothetical protein
LSAILSDDEDVELVSIASNTPNSPHPVDYITTPTGSPLAEPRNYSQPASPAKKVGDKQFRWKKGEVIGKGAYGKVFIGLNEETGALLAVKEIDCTFEDIKQELLATTVRNRSSRLS